MVPETPQTPALCAPLLTTEVAASSSTELLSKYMQLNGNRTSAAGKYPAAISKKLAPMAERQGRMAHDAGVIRASAAPNQGDKLLDVITSIVSLSITHPPFVCQPGRLIITHPPT